MRCEEKMRILKGLMLYYEYGMKWWESSKMDFIEAKKAIEEMMQKDYKTFITALISIEKDITNQDALDMMYQKFMNTDEMHLLNDEFDEIIEFVLWKKLWFNTKILGYNDDIP